jgi:hypothetical protein
MARKFFVGGNWKMNTLKSSADAIVKMLNDAQFDANVGKLEEFCPRSALF